MMYLKLCMHNIGILRLDLVCFCKTCEYENMIKDVYGCELCPKDDGFQRMKVDLNGME